MACIDTQGAAIVVVVVVEEQGGETEPIDIDRAPADMTS
jgi:hypothetical protein